MQYYLFNFVIKANSKSKVFNLVNLDNPNPNYVILLI